MRETMSQSTQTELIDPPEDEVDVDPENPDGELPDDVSDEATETEPEAEPGDDQPVDQLEISIEGFEPDEEEATEAKTPLVNNLRKLLRDAERKNKEYARQLAASAPRDPEIVVGEKPTLASCEFDDERYEREYANWVERKSKAESRVKQKQEAEAKEQQSWSAKLAQYESEKRELPVSDFAEAEATVRAGLSDTQLGMLVKAADKPAELIYAIGTNDKALSHLAGIEDAFTFAVTLGKIMAKTNASPKKSTIPAPARTVSGGGARTVANTSSNLEKMREEGLRKGDLTAYYAAKAKAR
jgi:hypothetical protein